MTCCDHAGYDGEGFHEYCCRCYTFEERLDEMLTDVLEAHHVDLPDPVVKALVKVMKDEWIL